MEIIAMVNEKGGTGKTTSTVNLAAALGEMGKKVLLVDLDGQAASSRWLGVDGDTRFAEALLAGKGLDPIRDIMPNVDLAPGHGKLDSVAHDLRPTQGGQLRKLLNHVEGYDYVLIDCPPSLGNRLIGNALLAATHALVPVETSVLALDGLKILLTTLEDIRDGFGHDIILLGVVACRFDGRTRLSRLVLSELKRALPNHLFETVIRENVRMRECPASGQSILAYAGDSHGAEDYRSLADEMVRRLSEVEDDAIDALASGVEEFEQVAESLEKKAEDPEAQIPEIDGDWTGIGQALTGSDAESAPPQSKPDRPAKGKAKRDKAKGKPKAKEQPVAETRTEATAPPQEDVEAPTEAETEPAAPADAPIAEVAPKPQPQAQAEADVAPEPPSPSQAEPVVEHQPPAPEPASQTPPPPVQPEPAATLDDLNTWPREADVVRTELAEQRKMKSWPQEEDFADEEPEPVAAGGGDETKKKPSWLRFFAGSDD